MINTLKSLVFSFLFFLTAIAAEASEIDDVCVRNFFPKGSEINPCDSGDSKFREVISADDPARSICTKSYENRLCQISPKEYRYVETVDGEVICTVHFHQEGVAEYCYSNPKVFSWARGR